MEDDLVQQSRAQALPRQAAAEHADILAPGRLGCLRRRGLAPFRGEGDPRLGALGGRIVSEDEDLSLESAAVDAIDPVPPLTCQLVPAPAGDDRTAPLHRLR